MKIGKKAAFFVETKARTAMVTTPGWDSDGRLTPTPLATRGSKAMRTCRRRRTPALGATLVYFSTPGTRQELRQQSIAMHVWPVTSASRPFYVGASCELPCHVPRVRCSREAVAFPCAVSTFTPATSQVRRTNPRPWGNTSGGNYSPGMATKW